MDRHSTNGILLSGGDTKQEADKETERAVLVLVKGLTFFGVPVGAV